MRTQALNRIFRLLITLVLAIPAIVPTGSPAVAQPASPILPHPAAVRLGAPPEGTVIARVYYTSEAEKDELAPILDVWEVNQKEGYLLVMLLPGELERLVSRDLRVEVDEERTAQLYAIRPVDPNQT
jgi:hypothetical protein